MLASASKSEDRALVEAALAAHEPSVEALLDRLLPVIRARVRRIARRGGRLEEADDLVQDFLLHLWGEDGRRLLAYDPSRGASLENYVGLLAERFCMDRSRERAAKKRGGHLVAVPLDEALPDADRDLEQAAAARQLTDRLGRHLDEQLSERGQLVLRYAFSDGRPAPEVAEILGVKVQVVYNWQHKIRDLARRFLAG